MQALWGQAAVLNTFVQSKGLGRGKSSWAMLACMRVHCRRARAREPDGAVGDGLDVVDGADGRGPAPGVVDDEAAPRCGVSRRGQRRARGHGVAHVLEVVAHEVDQGDGSPLVPHAEDGQQRGRLAQDDAAKEALARPP